MKYFSSYDVWKLQYHRDFYIEMKIIEMKTEQPPMTLILINIIQVMILNNNQEDLAIIWASYKNIYSLDQSDPWESFEGNLNP